MALDKIVFWKVTYRDLIMLVTLAVGMSSFYYEMENYKREKSCFEVCKRYVNMVNFPEIWFNFSIYNNTTRGENDGL